MSMENIFGIAGSAINAQMVRLNLTASNIANAGTTAPQPGWMNANALALNPTARQFDALCLRYNRQLLSEGASVVRGRM